MASFDAAEARIAFNAYRQGGPITDKGLTEALRCIDQLVETVVVVPGFELALREAVRLQVALRDIVLSRRMEEASRG